MFIKIVDSAFETPGVAPNLCGIPVIRIESSHSETFSECHKHASCALRLDLAGFREPSALTGGRGARRPQCSLSAGQAPKRGLPSWWGGEEKSAASPRALSSLMGGLVRGRRGRWAGTLRPAGARFGLRGGRPPPPSSRPYFSGVSRPPGGSSGRTWSCNLGPRSFQSCNRSEMEPSRTLTQNLL